jgi:hypothetical protein
MPVRPVTAQAVLSPAAKPASCIPRGATSSENRCAMSPICAKRPSEMPGTSVRNRRFRHSACPGRAA